MKEQYYVIHNYCPFKEKGLRVLFSLLIFYITDDKGKVRYFGFIESREWWKHDMNNI